MSRSIHIHYFSGTGNARKAAQWVADEAAAINLRSVLTDIGRKSTSIASPDTADDLLGFCYPTHGFNAPPIVLKYFWKFPKGKNRVFLLNTRAGLKLSKLHLPGIGGLALWLPFLILCLKGYRVRAFRPLDMPSNWISLHPGVKTTVVASIQGRCHHTVQKFSQRFLTGKWVLNGLRWIPVDIIVSPIAVGYYLYGRFMIAKTFFASNQCTNCGKCIKDCPVNAIKLLSGRPYWSFSCESCMHCMNYCPERAIETAHGFTILIWWLIMSILPPAIIALIAEKVWVRNTLINYDYLYNPVMLICGVIIVFLSYRFLHWALRFRWLNKLITWTSFTHYPFWRRYKA